jgi:uroporphyrinogen decarboxylase
LFPGFEYSDEPVKPDYSPWYKDKPFVDDWGCLWQTTQDGITGTVVEHPIKSLDDIEALAVPDPAKSNGLTPIDWDEEAARLGEQSKQGKPVIGGLRHGHTFLQLCDLRGYENLIFDMFDENPDLDRLIAILEDFNLGIIDRYIKLKPDVMLYPEDLGMQVGPMLRPEQFRKFIKPSYRRLIKPAREAGCCIHMHSDGDIRLLAEDLIEGGVEILNLQDTTNGIDWIKDNLKGRVCLDIDIDRQNVTRFGTPAQIDKHIGSIKNELGSKEGGLMMIYGLYPGVPLENVEAVMDSMQRYCFEG